MILAGPGGGWLPQSSAGREAVAGRLVQAGSSRWTCNLEVRLHRVAERSNEMVEQIWRLLEHGQNGRPRKAS